MNTRVLTLLHSTSNFRCRDSNPGRSGESRVSYQLDYTGFVVSHSARPPRDRRLDTRRSHTLRESESGDSLVVRDVTRASPHTSFAANFDPKRPYDTGGFHQGTSTAGTNDGAMTRTNEHRPQSHRCSHRDIVLSQGLVAKLRYSSGARQGHMIGGGVNRPLDRIHRYSKSSYSHQATCAPVTSLPLTQRHPLTIHT